MNAGKSIYKGKHQRRRKSQFKAYAVFWGVVLAIFLFGVFTGVTVHALCNPQTSFEGETGNLPTSEVKALTEVKYEQDTVQHIYIGECRITAYCIGACCCGDSADGYTATMTIAKPYKTIAVDPKLIPLGSTVYIEGQEFIAEDVGGAIKGQRIDVCMGSHNEAREFGVKYADVYYTPPKK